MLGSLRFRLPALFLLGIVLAGLVASLISIRFFQSYNHARAVDELRSESVGIVQLYARQAGRETVPPASLVARARRRQDLLGAGVPGSTLLQGIPSLPTDGSSIDQVGHGSGADDGRRSRLGGAAATSPSRGR